MRLKVRLDSFTVWFSAHETDDWCDEWPCSSICGHSVRASYDSNGLYDLTVDCKEPPDDLSAHELNALVSDKLWKSRLPEDHPAWFVAVGQFYNTA